MENPLAGMKTDYWYKVAVVVGAAIAVAAAPVSNSTFMIVGLGILFVGLGEWLNHPKRQILSPGYVGHKETRSNSLLGWILIVVGLPLLMHGIYRLVMN